MEIAMKSHVGRVRQVNEDYFACIADLNGRVLAVVADGMGGHQAGDIASRLAVERIVKELRHLDGELSDEDARERLMDALLMANEEVYQYAQQHPECSGMGTTIVAALLGETGGVTAHIGDSRLYHFNADGLQLKTEDHSLVHELMKSGQITAEEASVHPQRNVLMRALGTEPDVRIDLGQFNWSEGDVVLLCSDGLSNKVDHSVMVEWLKRPVSLQAQVDGLVEHALDAGGEDNITLVAVRNKPKPVTGNREG
ncbi:MULTISPECIES: Stp1/IreP family PP2C-type Ser/Thr phosphatase [Brevibacillus]|jgi:protein phosphatase|nr:MULTISPECIES: Stp1/IreP family PP2C-type Ser/Thr phosphatase [Bacillales]MBR8658213.1 Stp1/IreP family PP2C-type Ser/Thr phosphatase [Brevibacillus sp. NL20B1]REK62963.1 MAG: Stp1/IreP family PP2C-type Ser/Thr phosphatase [Brevibacillus sp.]UFJ61101.1 Stp1/IreP family PP2C-type Ser/Thr phosphatase [Anoxybacillus sediminis]